MRIKSLIAIGILSSMVLTSSCKKSSETAEAKKKQVIKDKVKALLSLR